MDRIDHRIAVSEAARESADRWYPGDYELIPNGTLIPPSADPAGRENRIVFVGRHDPRKGMPVLLRAWPRIRERTGAELRIVGADPLMVRLLLTRLGVSGEGIESLGFLSQEALTRGVARGQGARGALARRGELRDGADEGVRVCDSRGCLRHHRVP